MTVLAILIIWVIAGLVDVDTLEVSVVGFVYHWINPELIWGPLRFFFTGIFLLTLSKSVDLVLSATRNVCNRPNDSITISQI